MGCHCGVQGADADTVELSDLMGLLKGTFDDGAVSPLWLAVAAAPPTIVAIVAFQALPG